MCLTSKTNSVIILMFKNKKIRIVKIVVTSKFQVEDKIFLPVGFNCVSSNGPGFSNGFIGRISLINKTRSYEKSCSTISTLAVDHHSFSFFEVFLYNFFDESFKSWDIPRGIHIFNWILLVQKSCIFEFFQLVRDT